MFYQCIENTSNSKGRFNDVGSVLVDYRQLNLSGYTSFFLSDKFNLHQIGADDEFLVIDVDFHLALPIKDFLAAFQLHLTHLEDNLLESFGILSELGSKFLAIKDRLPYLTDNWSFEGLSYD